MSRAVIDQAGFKVCTIGLVISLVFGLALKSQISSRRVGLILQEAVARLEKDFIIDFKSAEVKLSSWGLPLPFLEIAQIRMSPKKALCQDTQIYIEKLVMPLSLVSLFTSKTLVDQISASNVELRIAEFNNCLATTQKASAGQNQAAKTESGANFVTQSQIQGDLDLEKSIFQERTAARLNKIKVDQLKIIFKNYPTQALDLRQVQIGLNYSANQLEKIQVNSRVYALKDPQSNLHYFRGDLALLVSSAKNNFLEADAKLTGLLLDGELEIFFLYNSLEQILKTDFSVKNIAMKPFIQLNLVESSWLNYPVGMHFQGNSQHHLDGQKQAEANLKSVQISGDQTFISIPEIRVSRSDKKVRIEPFSADIQNLNLNKLKNLSQLKGISESIENYGNFQGVFNFKDLASMNLSGGWANLEFIFSNRGRRELQKIDSFKVDGNLLGDLASLKLSDFTLNAKKLSGTAELQHNLKNQTTTGDAQLSGPLVDERVWSLLTQVPQTPDVKFQWNYKKSDDERHQIYFYADTIKTHGLKLVAPEFQMIQTLKDNTSLALAVNMKAKEGVIVAEMIKENSIAQLFKAGSVFSEKSYSSETLNLNLKGADWKNMSFEFETKVVPLNDTKQAQFLKSKGEWTENESLTGSLSIQQPTGLKRFNLLKNQNSVLTIQPL